MKKSNLKIVFGSLAILMIFTIASVLFLVSSPQPQEYPQDLEELESGCTSIQVGRLATTDGSVITAHSCDGNYRTWLNIVPHAKHKKGSKNKIYYGKMHNETSWDLRGLVLRGEIPQVEETYAFLNVAYPCMNEHQLAIGETTIRGRRELYNPEGVFTIEEIERLMLERCTNARDAIRLAGELVKKYGYSDSGECITIADPKEVWHFEIFGAGPLEIGAVWAAVRIPDDHVGVSANIPRIGELNLDDPDHYMASENVFSVAEEMGWWDSKSKEPFRFWKAYSGRRPFSTREYFILSTLAPSLNLDQNAKELPFSVKPDKKVSVRDVLAFYRQTYEGTEFDATKNLMVSQRRSKEKIKSPVISPWMSRDMRTLLNTLKPEAVQRFRTIAISGCSYSHVLQCRDWLPDPVGGICWFAFDNPGQSARIPIFAGATELPPSFEICAQHRFRTDSACWAFRRANRLATVRWGRTRRYIEDAIKEFEDRAFADLPSIEKKVLELYQSEASKENPVKVKKYLTKYTNDFARAAMHKYWELGDKFWAMFAWGF
ncbi:MAG: C69 family dipeptidase [Candidatus Aminicenantes bacterium]|nr:C69 family dipeptidase [Candidatus Aminicenantes bacterium]